MMQPTPTQKEKKTKVDPDEHSPKRRRVGRCSSSGNAAEKSLGAMFSSESVVPDLNGKDLLDNFTDWYQSILSPMELKRIEEMGDLHKGMPLYPFHCSGMNAYNRMFLWPRHLRNVINADFEQEPTDFMFTKQSEYRRGSKSTVSPEYQPKLSRPLCDLVNEAVAPHADKLTRKNLNTQLSFLAREAEVFVDQALEVLLIDNAKCLQGEKALYDSECWQCLPNSKRPCANWRFVRDSILKRSSDVLNPTSNFLNLNKKTIQRIEERFDKVFGYGLLESKNASMVDIVEQGDKVVLPCNDGQTKQGGNATANTPSNAPPLRSTSKFRRTAKSNDVCEMNI